jgi:NitT/TauT family transport system substrate-binding protein
VLCDLLLIQQVFIAKERGYFKQAGLDVEFEFFQAAQPMAIAIASGDIDYAVTAISGGLISLAGKRSSKGHWRCFKRRRRN